MKPINPLYEWAVQNPKTPKPQNPSSFHYYALIKFNSHAFEIIIQWKKYLPRL
jgi:hypothetical protein